MLSTSTPAGASKASTPVDTSPTSTSTTPGVSSRTLVVSAPVEVSAPVVASTTSESGVVGAGGRGSGGVGLDLQKKLLEPRPLKSRPRVEQGG